ncbi:MAG: ornithine cyclodeaminase family protein [Candidatus Theseobacter exili]|nr:ornithine cyclodeaminase family protein [Candidatus Theseobacter exili]
METMVLSATDVSKCLTVKKTMELVEYVFSEWGKGNIVMPSKITLDMARSGCESWSNAMPAYIVPCNAAGIKWIGGYAKNIQKKLPYIMGVIILTDPETGQTLAFMDGAYITNMRTGASAAISAKYLAGEEVNTICIVGTGTQGKTCALCLNEIYPSTEIRIADISEDSRKNFVHEMSKQLDMTIINVSSVEEAVRGSDLVVLVTTATKPFIRQEWIKPGATVLAMGSFQQIEDAFACSADKIVVDSWAQACHRGELKQLVESGKLNDDDFYSELGDIVINRKTGRESVTERILMIPVGLGAHDICIAQHVYKVASEKKLGTVINL